MKRTAFVLFLLCSAIAAAATTAAAQSQPNYSGTWQVDLAKSDFGPSPPPDSLTLVIDHKGSTIIVKSTQSAAGNQISNQRTVTTDGKPNQNTIRGMGGDQAITSTSKWDAGKLVTTYSLDLGGMKADIVETWDLGTGGSVLTNTRVITVPEGTFTIKAVFNKSK
jgi:hypothetical protein